LDVVVLTVEKQPFDTSLCTSRDGGSALLTQGVGVLEKIETVGGNH
jgi:hypothetical protein